MMRKNDLKFLFSMLASFTSVAALYFQLVCEVMTLWPLTACWLWFYTLPSFRVKRGANMMREMKGMGTIFVIAGIATLIMSVVATK